MILFWQNRANFINPQGVFVYIVLLFLSKPRCDPYHLKKYL